MARKTTRGRGEESRDIILSAARPLFARHGYDGTSLDEVARDAGFTKGAVYYFFRSKEALFLSLLDAIEVRSIGRTAEVMDAAEGTTERQIGLFIRLQAQWAGSNPDDLAILIRSSIDAVGEQSPVSARVAAIYARMEKALEGALLRDGPERARGAALSDVIVSLLALHDGNMLLWYRNGCDPAIGRRLVAATRRAMLFTIGLPG